LGSSEFWRIRAVYLRILARVNVGDYLQILRFSSQVLSSGINTRKQSPGSAKRTREQHEILVVRQEIGVLV
jgi:hypothetical protein